jgi:alpha-beta hydrolase superfamily lysophospholipase
MERLFQHIELVLHHYKIDKINILFGHSAGGLVAIMYSNYKNSNTHFVDRLILSSPFLDWYADPASTSLLGSEEFIEKIITPLGLILPKINLKSAKGKPNYTTCQEFNELAFNPKYKSLVETNTYPAWIRAVTISQQKIQNKEIDTRCKVDIFCSDKSVFWKDRNDADNTLDVDDIQKYGKYISKNVQIHAIKKSIHNCFLRINIDDYI